MNLPIALLFVFLLFRHGLSLVVWESPTDWNSGLPKSIKVFRTNSSITEEINMTAAYCKIDLSDPDIEFKVVSSEGKLKTPLEFMQVKPNYVYKVTNDGYFNMQTDKTINLAVQDKNNWIPIWSPKPFI